MRFDDMIATVLQRPTDRLEERVTQWRQLVDLLAQRRPASSSAETRAAFRFLRAHRIEVDLPVRERTAAALRGLRISPDLIALFGEDHPSVASALLRGAQLDADEWIGLLPGLTPTGRAILRHRRDLGGAVEQALAGFGAGDFVLGSSVAAAENQAAENQPPARPPEHAAPPRVAIVEPELLLTEPAPPAEGGRSQIWELVERIEAFQRNREGKAALPDDAPSADAFRWETGPEGVVLWVDGAPRGALVGQSIAAIAERGQHGVDGQAAGAYHKRAPFRDARFSVAGSGAAGGDWRLSGVPYFDPHRGHFLGYRGSARRPRIDEVAAAPATHEDGLFGTGMPADSLRQLTHELRTPLNAIIGFAEMIEGQYMGPAGSAHRDRASDIVEQARRLLAAVDDLDTAARVETSRAFPDNAVDLAPLLLRLHDAYERTADHRQARFATRIDDDLPTAAVDPAAAERMLARLLAATIGLASEGETIDASMRAGTRGGRRMLSLAIDRPQAIAGLDEPSLLHPGYSPGGDWPGAPALGLGFALRLVRKLAEAAGGTLEVGERRFELLLPAFVAAPPAQISEERV